MRLNARIMSASATALALMVPLVALAAEPDPDATVVAQLSRAGTPSQATSAANPTGPEGLTARPGENTTGDQTQQDTPIPTSPAPRVGLFPGFGKTLLDRGIDLHGTAFDRLYANTGEGVSPGHTSNLAGFRPAADFDLQKLIGLPGGNIHVGVSIFGLESDIPQITGQAGGFLTGFQTVPVTEHDILSVLTYEQRLLGDRLSIEVGRTNVYNYFLLPNSLDPFTHFSSTFEVDGDFNSPPYPNWGGRATYKFAPTWYVQGGAFEDDFYSAVDRGNAFGDSRSTGAQILAEIGQRSEFSNAAYPSNLEAGFEWNTRTGRSNLKGTGAPANTLLQVANYPGGGVIYMQGQKVLWRGVGRAVGPPASVAVYGSLDVAVDKPQPIDMDTMAGFNFTGFVPGRPFDALGIQARYQRLSQIEADGETRRQRLLIRGGRNGPEQPRDGYALELVGNIQVTPAIAVRPIVQYFINPDNYYPPAPPGRPQSGFEAGVFAVVSLGRLLGTSVKAF